MNQDLHRLAGASATYLQLDYVDHMRRGFRAAAVLVIMLQLVFLGACGESPPAAPSPTAITLYTCVNDTTIQPVIAEFQATHPEVKVELFRAPTGQLNARVASDVRSGGLRADVIWACDPLTMQDYVAQDLIGGWTPQTDIPATVRTEDYVGVALLYMVAVTRKEAKAPAAWPELASAGKVAVRIRRLPPRRSGPWPTSAPTSTPI